MAKNTYREFKTIDSDPFKRFFILEETFTDNSKGYSVKILENDEEDVILDCFNRECAKELFFTLIKAVT